MKYIVVILDGASGWPLEELEDCTTLEAASTPILDLMARQGRVGLAHTVPEGLEPSSSAACTSILGFDPAQNFVGRAAIEAAAMGIELAEDEIALRVNTLTLDEGIMRSYAGGHITTEESRAIIERLAQQLNDETFTLYPGVAYRHILVVKGHPELLETTYTAPHDISDQAVEGYLPQGPGAELLADFTDRARDLLASDPTNEARKAAAQLPITDLWPFWPGSAPAAMPTFEDTYHKSAALTSGVDLLFGLANLFSIDTLHIAGVTDGPDTDYFAQVTEALAALDDHDVVVIHIESPDEMAHSGDVSGKMDAIEAIDKEVMTRVLSYGRKNKDIRVLAMPDHPTPISTKTHAREAVPFLLWGSGVTPDEASTYDERAARESGWELDDGYQVMAELLDFEPTSI
ncbi:MAG: cofactor-independent phosphoglycerate mutase [Actinomycetia bacterium]|nr:cofactor-independent phosphoglycerate mutase [Actinomycetes bacterium]